jgi:GTP-binding protein HflX
VPELIVVNKVDAADPMVVARLKASEPHSVAVSAHTGEGIADVLAAVEADLPRPGVQVTALVPYARGDLLNRAHEHGEVLSLEHTGDGTLLHARVNEDLAGELAPYATEGLTTA